MKILDRGVIGTIFELGVEFAPTGFMVADQTTSHPKVPIQSPLDLALTIFKRSFYGVLMQIIQLSTNERERDA